MKQEYLDIIKNKLDVVPSGIIDLKEPLMEISREAGNSGNITYRIKRLYCVPDVKVFFIELVSSDNSYKNVSLDYLRSFEIKKLIDRL